MDEFDLIDRLIAPLATAPGAQGLANDGATIAPSPGCELVITKDMMAEGIHFLPGDPAGDLARKLLRVNLSDLAAMGARPLGYLLGFAGDGQRSDVWYREFLDGLARDQDAFGISLLGGDTISSPHGVLTLSLTALGEVAIGQSLPRGGVLPGDLVAVTGTVGDGGLGLMVLQDRLPGLGTDDGQYLAGRYRLPQPRTVLGPALVGVAHAVLDVSDGLLADAGHLARRSQLAINLDWTKIPLSPAARNAMDIDTAIREVILTGGDDYELLFTFAPDQSESVAAIANRTGVAVTVIGRCQTGQGVHVLDGDGAEIRTDKAGWRHRG